MPDKKSADSAQTPQNDFIEGVNKERDRYHKDISWNRDTIGLSSGNPKEHPYFSAVELTKQQLDTEAMTEYHGSGLAYHKDGYTPYLKELGITQDLNYGNFVPTNGGTHAYALAVANLLDKNDVLLVPTPTYGYFIAPKLVGHTNVVPIPLREEDGYKLNPEYLDQEIKRINKGYANKGSDLRVSAFLNINPHNPTGVVHNKCELEGIAKVLKKHDLKLVIDDLAYLGTEYDRYVFYRKEEERTKPRAVPIASIDGMFDRTLSIFSLSKAYGLTGLRAGLAVGPEKFIKPMRKEIGRREEFLPITAQAALISAFGEQDNFSRSNHLSGRASNNEKKYNLLRVMINGWDNDLEARAYVQENIGSTPEEAARNLCSAHLMRNITAPTKVRFNRPKMDTVRLFKQWLDKLDDQNNLPNLRVILDTESKGVFQPPSVARFVEQLVAGSSYRDALKVLEPIACRKDEHTTDDDIKSRFLTLFDEEEMKDFREAWKTFDKEQEERMAQKGQQLQSLLQYGLPRMKVLPIAKAGFFAMVDATPLRNEHVGYSEIHDDGDIARELSKHSNVVVLPGGTMGADKNKLLLRISFSDEIDTLIDGMLGIRGFLKQRNIIPDSTMKHLEAAKNLGPEHQSTAEKLLSERFGEGKPLTEQAITHPATSNKEKKSQQNDDLKLTVSYDNEKYHTMRLIVNGWHNDTEVRNYFHYPRSERKDFDILLEKLRPPLTVSEVAEPKTSAGYHGYGIMKIFQQWLDEHCDKDVLSETRQLLQSIRARLWMRGGKKVRPFLVPLLKEGRIDTAALKQLLEDNRWKEEKKITPEQVDKLKTALESELPIFQEAYHIFDEEQMKKIEADRSFIASLMRYGVPGLQMCPSTWSNHFVTVDATSLKKQLLGHDGMNNVDDIARRFSECSGLTITPNKAAKEKGDKLLLNISCPDDIAEFFAGMLHTRNFLAQFVMPDSTMKHMEVAKNLGPEHQSATEKLLSERFGEGKEYHHSRQ